MSYSLAYIGPRLTELEIIPDYGQTYAQRETILNMGVQCEGWRRPECLEIAQNCSKLLKIAQKVP